MSEDFMCITSIRNCLCCDKEMKGDDDFCVACEKDDLERQLAEAREDVKTYKYDLETLVSIVTDCVYEMSEEERYDTLKQVSDHYKQLKEKGE